MIIAPDDATPAPVIDIPTLIDTSPVGLFQLGIFLLAGASLIVDGFDVQSMGFVAPELLRGWGIEQGALGPIFSASLIGMTLGSLVLSVVADHIGRRPVLVSAMLLAGLSMLGTAGVANLMQLLVMRALTGAAVGAIMGNAMALVSEYSPARQRATAMMLVSCGFTAGAMSGGMVAGWLIPVAGWRAVFVAGGLLSLGIGLLMAIGLPESVQWLVLRGASGERVARIAARIARGGTTGAGVAPRYAVRDANRCAEGSTGTVAALFRDGRGRDTLLLWGLNFTNLLNLFLLANWLPTIVTNLGHTRSVAIAIGTLLQVGGMLGTIGMGFLVDRVGYRRVLVPGFIVAAAAVASLSEPGLPLPALFAAALAGGMCIVGVQPAINALTASAYPSGIRATGIGWGLGIGRVGSILGPMVVGQIALLAASDRTIFVASALIALASGTMMLATREVAARGGAERVGR